jgi:hypothetical protein
LKDLLRSCRRDPRSSALHWACDWHQLFVLAERIGAIWPARSCSSDVSAYPRLEYDGCSRDRAFMSRPMWTALHRSRKRRMRSLAYTARTGPARAIPTGLLRNLRLKEDGR